MADTAWDQLGDLTDGIAMPMVGARFIAGLDSEGNRSSNFQVHFDDRTVTPIEVVGLVFTSMFEWMHDVLHDRDDGA